jgi:hypothetical protein
MTLVVFPLTCRVVGVTVADALRSAVWPAVWPVIPAGLLVAACRGWTTGTPGLAAVAASAAVVYGAAFFFIALPAKERRWYGSHLSALLRRRAVLLPG